MSKKIKIGDCFKMYPNDRHPGADDYFMIAIDKMYYGRERYIESLSGTHTTVCYTEDDLLQTLHLPIGNNPKKYGGAWFDLIRSGVKKEEYREFFGMDKGSPINIKTLVDWQKEDWQWLMRSFVERSEFMYDQISFKPWKVLHLTNGYGHSKPQLWAHIDSISIGRGNPEWGAPVDRDVFIIRLGEVFHTKNLKP